jgi:hypothetical protein
MKRKTHDFLSVTGISLLGLGSFAIAVVASVAGYKTWFPDMAFPAAFILIMTVTLGTPLGMVFAMSAWLKRTPVPCDKCGAASYRRRSEEYYEYHCSRCGRVMLGSRWKDPLGD